MALTTEQQSKMWDMLNKTRGKIGLTAYKDYIFCILFYKYLSEKAEIWLESKLGNQTWREVYDIDNKESLSFMNRELGYAIRPGEFFNDWKNDIDNDTFSIITMSDSFAHFNQQLNPKARNGFEGIFDGMRFDSSDLGSNAQARTQVMISMIDLLSSKEFDTSDNDTISDIYEYLVAQFATVLASDMGQFYTPKEVSEIMAKIVTYGHEDDETFSLYDPTVGSGSLLLTAATYLKKAKKEKNITYYGQEMDATPYRLARMNLMMHDVSYRSIHIHHADTLASDWPDGVVDGKDSPRLFDAVMANPPYSAHWNNVDREDDPRWRNYGVAPKTKADYAFLLHCLYHLKSTGKMAIILPHGVLFRSAEKKIRKALLDNHQIESIIGLPANLFLKTPIPVCVLILSKNRMDSDVLFVDASNEFEKVKTSNVLKLEHIDKIVDTVVHRKEIDKYSSLIPLDKIIENDYILNIPRYVDTFEAEDLIDMESVGKDAIALAKSTEKLEAELLNDFNDLTFNDDLANWIKGALEVLGHDE